MHVKVCARWGDLFSQALFTSLASLPSPPCSSPALLFRTRGHAWLLFWACHSHLLCKFPPTLQETGPMHLLFQHYFHCCWQLGISPFVPTYNAPLSAPHQEQYLPNGFTSACLLAHCLGKLRTCSLGPMHLRLTYIA